MMKKVLAFMAMAASISFGSALSTLAESMKAGEWKELSTLNLSGDFLYSNVNGDYWWNDMATTWTNYLCWNPATRDLHWAGAPHLAPYAVIRYSEQTNAWSMITDVPACMRLGEYQGCFNHGYDLGTIDQDKGIFYYKSTSTFFSYVIATKTWSQWSISQFSQDRADGMAFFPPLKKLCHVIGGTVRLVDPATRAVESVSSGLSMGGYNNTAEYSPVHRKVYFGGGSTAFYSLDSAKRVTRLADAPESYNCDYSSLACDPVTGNPLILANSNNYYMYSATANQWTQITNPPAALNAPSSAAKPAMATGISEYGVVFYMSPNLKKVYLYKHAAGTAAAEARPAPVSAALSDLPNPVSRSTLVSLKAEAGSAFRIYDLRGSLLADVSRLSVGVYLMESVSAGLQSVKKIAVIR